MAVSKALRFQILRRDGHTCRYCGRSSPEVKLTVDHVVPQTLGGSDDPSNLVTACSDCNSGKSATPPDAEHVAQVGEDALRWAGAMRTAADAMLGDLQQREADHAAFKDAWSSWTFGKDNQPVPLPETWQRSIDAFTAAGLPMPILTECVRIAMNNQKVKPDQTFRYMCGVAWSRVSRLQEAARAEVAGTNQDGWAPSSVAPFSLTAMQRDAIAVPAHSEGRCELAEGILSMFTEDEQERYFSLGREAAERDGEDDLDGPESGPRAARAAVSDMQVDIAVLSRGIEILIDQLPFEIGAFASKEAWRIAEEGLASCTDVRVTAGSAIVAAAYLAKKTLASLPEDTRDALIAEAKSRMPEASEDDLILDASREAQVHLFIEEVRQNPDLAESDE